MFPALSFEIPKLEKELNELRQNTHGTSTNFECILYAALAAQACIYILV